MRTDDTRTIIAIADGPQLSAAVRERTPRDLAIVRWTRPNELADVWPRCRPWPWIVLGAGAVPPPLSELCLGRPVVVGWLGGEASTLPEGWRRFPSWPDLARWLQRLPRVRIGGLGLAPFRGVRTEAGDQLGAPVLEALLAAHPWGLAPSPMVRGAVAQLSRRGLPCTLRRRGKLLRLVKPGEQLGRGSLEGVNR